MTMKDTQIQADWPQTRLLNFTGMLSKFVQNKRLAALCRWFGWVNVFLITALHVAEFMYLHEQIVSENPDFTEKLLVVNDMCAGLQCCGIIAGFLSYETSLYNALTSTSELVKEGIQLYGEKGAEIMSKCIRRNTKAFYIFASSTLVLVHYLLRPWVYLFIHDIRKFTLHSSLPLDPYTWYGFIVDYFFQLLPLWFFMIAIAMFLSLFVSLSQLIEGTFQVLKGKMESINFKTDPDATLKLKECIKYHQKILKACYHIRKGTAFVLIVQCFFATLTLCTSLYEMTYVNMDLNMAMNIFEEGAVELVWVGVYCNCCSEMTKAADDAVNSPYFSDWYEASQVDKKTLQIFMTITRKPVTFGGFLELNLLTFINVLKTAFSYYNFLGAMNHK